VNTQDTKPDRTETHQPGPEEHPGEDGPFVDAPRKRLKRPVPDDRRPDDPRLPDGELSEPADLA
jgi:hypothetical protein